MTFFEQAYKHLLHIIATIHPEKTSNLSSSKEHVSKEIFPKLHLPKLLLGLSGGADSVFLFHLLLHARSENKLDFVAAHLNHQWRDDADDTVTFCKILSEKHAVPFFIDMLETYKPHLINRGSSEDLGRQARLLFFKRTSDQQNIRWSVLGHHADDQIESFFIKLIRGTTLEGIGGMQTIAQNRIRPLLLFSKQQIISYLTEQGHAWYHDSTNDSDAFLRNKIRSQLIPSLQKVDQRSLTNIRRFQVHATLDADFFIHETNRAIERVTKNQPAETNARYSRSLFFREHPALQKRILTRLLYKNKYDGTISEGIILEIIRFLIHNQGGEHSIKHLVIHKKQDIFWINP
ncbi:tRNA lysidine(34) synthetase TilS [Candidatus Babeliales bacterium]|nr:tRNA lysidine(34) synthetase TilS [Candidatus Babeliales bacterium]